MEDFELIHDDAWYDARRKGRWAWYAEGELPAYVKRWIQEEDELQEGDTNG